LKDLSIYFSPVDEPSETLAKSSVAGTIGSQIETHFKSFPEIEAKSLVFIFVNDVRGGTDGQSNLKSIHKAIRRDLYRLFFPQIPFKIYDLGTIQAGDTIQDTHFAVRDTCSELIKHNTIPVLIGGSEDIAFANYLAYQKLEQTLNVLAIDRKIDMEGISEEEEMPVNQDNYLTRIILHQPATLFNLTVMGTQSYFVNPEIKELMEKLYFDIRRLGEAQADITANEPVIRSADMVSVDMSVLRRSDFAACATISPNGFYGEELCRLVRYAGMSDKMTSIGFYNFSGSEDDVSQSSMLFAQVLFYFMEGVAGRKRDYPMTNKSEYIKYTVLLDQDKYELVFYKSPKSDRWWMEVPYPPENKIRFQRHLMIPCTYTDYQMALQNEMPDLWWRTYQKLVL
jgi:arginase family enzyme